MLTPPVKGEMLAKQQSNKATKHQSNKAPLLAIIQKDNDCVQLI
jgi:hypothetical protein